MCIIDNKIKNYIENLYGKFNNNLEKLQEYGYQNKFPIIRNDTAKFIITLMYLKDIKYILEIGTNIGFSTSVMATFLKNDGHITTIERCKDMVHKARENFIKLNLSNKITILEGDALNIIKNIKKYYDLIFIDGAKGHYTKYFKESIKKLKIGGVIIADDVLQKGNIMPDIYNNKRNKTINKRMDNFLKIICNTTGLETTILPIGNGLSLSIKTKENISLKEIAE